MLTGYNQWSTKYSFKKRETERERERERERKRVRERNRGKNLSFCLLGFDRPGSDK